MNLWPQIFSAWLFIIALFVFVIGIVELIRRYFQNREIFINAIHIDSGGAAITSLDPSFIHVNELPPCPNNQEPWKTWEDKCPYKVEPLQNIISTRSEKNHDNR